MNTHLLFYCRLALAVFLSVGSTIGVNAQTTKRKGSNAASNGTASTPEPGVHVKITERTSSGEVHELERTYPISAMNADERDKLIDHLVDSLRARRGDKKAQITITVEESDADRHPVETRRSESGNLPRSRNQGKDLYTRRNGNGPYEFRYYKDGKLQEQYSFHPDSLADRLNRLEFKFPQNFTQRMDDAFRNWSWSFNDGETKSPTIQNLQAFPNNPATNELNIRFTALSKGNVHIRVTTPDGKEMASKEVKDFSGSYTGQIDVGRKAHGVCFINVTQNEDGAVKRVVLP